MNRYPLWRYLLMAAIIMFGVIYALPNLYGEDPAIQISPKGGVNIQANVVQELAAGLKQQSIPYKSIKLQTKTNSVLIRFKSEEAQLKALDIVQAIMGDNYTVALNLASNTPKWLQILGAKPMKLGLDLRGGIHFLLKVDVQAMIKEVIANDVQAMGTSLRQAFVRYSGIARDGKYGITIRFRTNEALAKAKALLQKSYPTYTYTESQVDDQYLLNAVMQQQERHNLEQNAVKQNISILKNRVNELGVAEPVIQQQGKDHISVDLPGIQDTARAKDLIGKVATIRLQLVDTEHDANTAARTGIVPFGTTLYKYQGHSILLKNQIVLHGRAITSATTIIGDDGRPAVSVRVGGSGVALFNKITGANVGKPMATVYVETKTIKKIVNGKLVTRTQQVDKVINVATIQSALGRNFQILGLESMRSAKNLALLLRSGAFAAPVSFVQERTVGPSLGKKNIHMGVLSTIVGSLLVIIFMAIYYRLFGLVADFALIMNVILLIAFMSILGFTLTLPGIAGIVLTVGMAVDANVLIDERIREELRNGVSPQASINAGYDRAFSTIVDANVTTLIVAVVLFALGTGPVQGFAVTISLGLLISMVTSIFFTRAIVNLVYGRRQVKQLSIGIKVKREE